MKPLLALATGMSLSALVAIEAIAVIAQGGIIGRDTGVSGIVVMQLGALVIAIGALLKAGMYVEEWRRVLKSAADFAATVEKLADRMEHAETRLNAHDKHMASIRLLVNDHEVRIHGPVDLFKKDVVDEAAG